jgi:citrate lyase gamma subunit
MSNITIQINSLEALERLIGNDNELEISIRNSVVQSFAGRHLKALANESLMKSMALDINKYIETKFFQTIGEGWSKKVVLKQSLQNELDEMVKKIFDNIMRETIQTILDEKKTVAHIDTVLERRVNYIMEELSEKVIEENLNKLVNKRIKEQFGL